MSRSDRPYCLKSPCPLINPKWGPCDECGNKRSALMIKWSDLDSVSRTLALAAVAIFLGSWIVLIVGTLKISGVL